MSPASVLPALAPGWVAQPVTFEAGGVTIYGTYTHPGSGAAGTVPAALLIASLGGSTDRNDNAPGDTAHRDTFIAVANWLSADGVASLRHDKLGSGQTGWGKYAAHPDQVGSVRMSRRPSPRWTSWPLSGRSTGPGCPCMFDPTADPGHKAMRLVFTLTGAVPRRV